MASMYDYWLCCIPGVGNRSTEKLLELCGSVEQIYKAPKEELSRVLNKRQLEELDKMRAGWDLQGEFEKMKGMDIGFLTREDGQYPGRLKNIPDAPYGIFYKGSLPRENCLSVAVIGARDCSEYGRYVATELGKFLGTKGAQVISGMARGIDGISQEAALDAGGTTTAVLGSGVDVCYPVQNRKLYEKILAQGCIISSYPPGTVAKSQNFPPRNRIVSGLADVVVVIEARNKSGTLITVDMALEQGKEVYVVPGRITDRLSDGCNKLLKQGAGILLSPKEFWEEVSDLRLELCAVQQSCEAHNINEVFNRKDNVAMPSELEEIYQLLDFAPQTAEQILEKLPKTITIAEVNTRLMRLCMQGFAIQHMAGYFGLSR